MKYSSLSKISLLALGFFLVCAGVALAQSNNFVPLADIGSQSSKLSNLYATNDLSGYINALFKFALSIGATAAVLRIAYAGYLYMGSADMWSSKSHAKEVLGNVIFGILLLLAIYLILYQINPDIVQLNALKNIKPIQTGQTPTQNQTQGSANPSDSGFTNAQPN